MSQYKFSEPYCSKTLYVEIIYPIFPTKIAKTNCSVKLIPVFFANNTSAPALMETPIPPFNIKCIATRLFYLIKIYGCSTIS